MQLLNALLAANPSSPRLTIYDETEGSRLDFSATTLDNWAAKVANMLREELDLEAGDNITLALPVNWQAVVIILGALAAEVEVEIIAPHPDAIAARDPLVVFVPPELQSVDTEAIVVAVTSDPFGRGVVECGGELLPGVVDFSPTTRAYGDVFYEDGPALTDTVAVSGAAQRVLGRGWDDWTSFEAQLLAPLATGGSVVTVVGEVDEQRLEEIVAAENVELVL
ncbi:MAG: TIGR03089 family protein [Corynebacterium sp.]|nr:TIGR03089 family protein [Corynebacterium sp.]